VQWSGLWDIGAGKSVAATTLVTKTVSDRPSVKQLGWRPVEQFLCGDDHHGNQSGHRPGKVVTACAVPHFLLMICDLSARAAHNVRLDVVKKFTEA